MVLADSCQKQHKEKKITLDILCDIKEKILLRWLPLKAILKVNLYLLKLIFNVEDFSSQYHESAVMKASWTESIKTVVD